MCCRRCTLPGRPALTWSVKTEKKDVRGNKCGLASASSAGLDRVMKREDDTLYITAVGSPMRQSFQTVAAELRVMTACEQMLYLSVIGGVCLLQVPSEK